MIGSYCSKDNNLYNVYRDRSYIIRVSLSMEMCVTMYWCNNVIVLISSDRDNYKREHIYRVSVTHNRHRRTLHLTNSTRTIGRNSSDCQKSTTCQQRRWIIRSSVILIRCSRRTNFNTLKHYREKQMNKFSVGSRISSNWNNTCRSRCRRNP